MVKDLWLIGTRHLLTQPARTLLTIAGIALGVSLSVAIQTANVDVLRAFEQAVTTVAGRATLQVSAGESDLDERLIAEIRRHPAVLSAMPVLQRVAQVREGPAEGNSLVIYGLDLLEAGNLKDFTIDVGEPPAVTLETLLRPDGLFVGEDLARRSGIQVGQTLRILVGTRVYQVTVLGVVRPVAGVASAWASLAVMDIAAAQALFDAVGRLDRIELVTGPTSAIEAVRKDLTGLLPPGVAVQRPAQRNEQVEHMLRAFQLNLTTLSAVGLLVGLLLVYNTVSFNVVQRRREIGIVRALGMPRPRVASLFLAESALMGLLGGLAGTGLGVLLATVIVQLMTRTVSELYMPVPAQPGVRTFLPPQVGLIGVGLGVVVSMIGALAPSLTASRTAPARALAYGDYEAVQGARTGSLAVAGGVLLAGAALLALPGPVRGIPVFGYGSALTLLLGLACFAPGLVQATGALAARGHALVARIGRPVGLARLAADQVGRAPGRNAVTVATLMIGIAIMVGVGVMIHSFRQTVNAWITQTIMADLIIVPATWLKTDDPRALGKGIPPKWIEAVGQVPGVAAIDPYRERRIEHGDRPLALVSRDLALHAERSRYLFLAGDSESRLAETLARNGVILSEALAARLALRAGDDLALETPVGPRQFPVTGVFYDYATDGGKVVMDRGLYRTLWEDGAATVLAAYLAPTADPEVVRGMIQARLHTLAGHAGTAVVIKNTELKAEILAIFDRTFTITYVLEFIAVVIGVLGIVNTLVTSVLERRRELATFRAIGASGRQVRRLVLWESLQLGGLGAVLGIPGGLSLAVLLIKVINKQSFGWSIQTVIPPAILLEAVGVAVLAALVAGYVPARWAAAQPVVDGLRYE